MELRQALGGGLKSFLHLAKREAEVRASGSGGLIEARTWNGGDADFLDEIFRERQVVGKAEGGDVRHDVVSAARLEAAEARAREDSEHAVAAREIFARQRFIVTGRKSQCERTGFLERRGGADGEKIVDLADGRTHLRRRDGPADPPAGDAVSLRAH